MKSCFEGADDLDFGNGDDDELDLTAGNTSDAGDAARQ